MNTRPLQNLIYSTMLIFSTYSCNTINPKYTQNSNPQINQSQQRATTILLNEADLTYKTSNYSTILITKINNTEPLKKVKIRLITPEDTNTYETNNLGIATMPLYENSKLIISPTKKSIKFSELELILENPSKLNIINISQDNHKIAKK